MKVDQNSEGLTLTKVFFSIFRLHLNSACAMFRVKRVNLHLRNDVRQIIYTYENCIVRLACVGLAQARLNKCSSLLPIIMHLAILCIYNTAFATAWTGCILSHWVHVCQGMGRFGFRVDGGSHTIASGDRKLTFTAHIYYRFQNI